MVDLNTAVEIGGDFTDLRGYIGTHGVEVVTGHGQKNKLGGQEEYVVTFRVHESTNNDLQNMVEQRSTVEASVLFRMGRFAQYFIRDIRGVLAPFVGAVPSDNGANWEAARASLENGEFTGRLLIADVWDTGKVFGPESRKAGQPICNIKFSLGPETN